MIDGIATKVSANEVIIANIMSYILLYSLLLYKAIIIPMELKNDSAYLFSEINVLNKQSSLKITFDFFRSEL